MADMVERAEARSVRWATTTIMDDDAVWRPQIWSFYQRFSRSDKITI